MFTPTDDATLDLDNHAAAQRDPGRAMALVCLGIFFGLIFTGLGAAIWEWNASRPVASRHAVAAAKPGQADPAFTVQLDGEVARLIAGALIALAALFVLVILPSVLPPILSRRGYLSIGRWLLMAGFCAFVATGGSLFLLVGRREFPIAAGIFYGATILPSIPAVFGVAGCLLAAAIYPKDPANPGSQL